MKIPAKGFLLEIFRISALSALGYFALMPLTERFVPFLKPFVFLIVLALFVVLFYLAAAHFKTFYAEIKGDGLLISKGFLIRRKERLSLKSAVSVKFISTPFMRILGLSSLLLIFEGSVCFLHILRKSDAVTLFEEINKIREQNEKI